MRIEEKRYAKNRKNRCNFCGRIIGIFLFCDAGHQGARSISESRNEHLIFDGPSWNDALFGGLGCGLVGITGTERLAFFDFIGVLEKAQTQGGSKWLSVQIGKGRMGQL